MIPADLIEILRCPQTGLPFVPPAEGLLAELNARIGRNDERVHNQAGTIVGQPLDDALVRSDVSALYPVRDGIPVLLADEAILLPLP